MTKQIVVIAAVCLLCACNSPKAKDTPATDKTETAAPTTPVSGVSIDPVCKMEKDTTWIDYQVHNSDTIHFCSETCKTAFAGNPSKYLK